MSLISDLHNISKSVKDEEPTNVIVEQQRLNWLNHPETQEVLNNLEREQSDKLAICVGRAYNDIVNGNLDSAALLIEVSAIRKTINLIRSGKYA